MKLLLHICCAPCLLYPLERLREKGYEISGFFYNPNIHPIAEYTHRREAIGSLAGKAGLKVIYPEYAPLDFFQQVKLKEEKPKRCPACWEMRLKATANLAKKNNFDAFSTTLLVSPYQDQEMLKEIGNAIHKAEEIDFYYEDLRAGFRKAHDLAKKEGIYCQKYCGCIYSQAERCKK